MRKVQEGNYSFIPELQPATHRRAIFLAQHQYIEIPEFLKILIFFILKIYGSLVSVLYTEHNLKLQAQEGEVGGLPYERAEMLVVSLRGVNCRFWPPFGCSGENTIIFSRKGLF